mmetsp:Transcript_25843/g.87189  ORF Transcript_25843/g.87189 Transcript_25843/m.87189 type:complete len:222 (+) Transcript_25843:481-1146(+)
MDPPPRPLRLPHPASRGAADRRPGRSPAKGAAKQAKAWQASGHRGERAFGARRRGEDRHFRRGRALQPLLVRRRRDGAAPRLAHHRPLFKLVPLHVAQHGPRGAAGQRGRASRLGARPGAPDAHKLLHARADAPHAAPLPACRCRLDGRARRAQAHRLRRPLFPRVERAALGRRLAPKGKVPHDRHVGGRTLLRAPRRRRGRGDRARRLRRLQAGPAQALL